MNLSKFILKDMNFKIIDSFSVAIGNMLVLIIPFLFKTNDKIIKKDEICTKKILNIKQFIGP